MPKKKKPKSRPGPPIEAEAPATRKRIWLLALGLLLVEVIVVPGAASPFRVPKDVVALGVILLVVGISLVGQLARGRVGFRWSPVATVLLCLPLLQLVSAAWSSNPRLAVTAAAQTAIWILGGFFIATTTRDERGRLILAAAVGAAISSVVLILQASGLRLLALDLPSGGGRSVLTGLTGNPADLAMAAVLLLPLVVVGSTASKRGWLRWALAAVLSLAVAVSQTLTGLVALGLFWCAWLIHQRSKRLWMAAGAAAVVVIGIGMASGLDQRVRNQLWRLQQGDWYFLLSARADGWTAAGEMIRARPVTGAGAANYSYMYYPSRVSWIERSDASGRRSELATHFDLAHCDPLQMVAELGVPGLIWMVGILWVLVRCRSRGDPLLTLAAAAFLPFGLLHFPTHLAVGLVPLILILGSLLASAEEVSLQPGVWVRRLAAVAVAALVLIGAYWQLQRMTLNLWRGGLTFALASAETLDQQQRVQQAAMVESHILPRIPAVAGGRHWMWRLVGQARFLRGEDQGAEAAFRTAMGLWPHEEAEFGLGLALAGQARYMEFHSQGLDSRNLRGEALVHLTRVCRTNPALLRLIPDDDLRRAVTEIVQSGAGQR